MSKLRQKQRAAGRAAADQAERLNVESSRKARTFMASHAFLRPQMELAVPPCLLWGVTHVILKNPELSGARRQFFEGIVPHLEAATAEVFMGLPPKLAKDATQAAGWAAVHSYDCPEGGRAAGTLFMGAIFWLQAILETEYLVLHPDSHFSAAAAALIEDLERVQEAEKGQHIFAKMEHAARKLARRMQERLEEAGLFVGATQPLPAMAAE